MRYVLEEGWPQIQVRLVGSRSSGLKLRFIPISRDSRQPYKAPKPLHAQFKVSFDSVALLHWVVI